MTSLHSQYPLLHIDLNQQAIDCHDPILLSPKSTSLSLSSSSSSTLLCPRDHSDQAEHMIKKEKLTEFGTLTCFSGIRGEKNNSMNWSSTKIRLNRKSDDGNRGTFSLEKDHKDGSVRVCADCNTTRTPLWRSGPKGPKSLCNACGIRQRKARRAMAAAAGGGAPVPVKINEGSSPTKKRRKLKKNRAAEDGLFPQDETDAAILLMALSYGMFTNSGH